MLSVFLIFAQLLLSTLKNAANLGAIRESIIESKRGDYLLGFVDIKRLYPANSLSVMNNLINHRPIAKIHTQAKGLKDGIA